MGSQPAAVKSSRSRPRGGLRRLDWGLLRYLRIRNLALVEDLALELEPGFTVLTGETGAGKSLLVDALALLVGARADADVVRLGSDRADVEGLVEGPFEVWAPFLEGRGLPPELPVVLRREVGAGGRSRAWINGASCAMADLREAGRLWMRLASQHDHQSLLVEERHLALLDEVLGLRPDLEAQVAEVREADLALRARRRSESEREGRLAWLEEHLEGLTRLAPRPGEWAQLRAEREPLRHAALLEASYGEAAEGLGGALGGLQTSLKALSRAATVLPGAQEEVDRLRSALLELEDLEALSRDQCLHWGRAGAARLEAVETRLAAYERLARRHHRDPEELADLQKQLSAEQKSLQDGETSLAALEASLATACDHYLAGAERLHEARRQALAPLEREVHRRLAHLGMGGARLQARLGVPEDAGSPVLRLGTAVRLGPAGFSSLALWFEPNVGEGFRPLARIASGGELSRVLLALLGAGQAASGQALTLVLDEVDAGLGGETALAVGAALEELAARQQVLVVTHLAQVAARAHHHGILQKETQEGRTRSLLTWTREEARVRELARLLSGHPDRPEALQHARTLLT
jgi:DNA repair protein RecN (Recombination protein N)